MDRILNGVILRQEWEEFVHARCRQEQEHSQDEDEDEDEEVCMSQIRVSRIATCAVQICC